jgi:predicted NodU family carbamoyl transferase
LANTSFNSRGHPILNTAKTALELLDSTPELDKVLIEDWLFSKP